jgi:hypothetical protein
VVERDRADRSSSAGAFGAVRQRNPPCRWQAVLMPTPTDSATPSHVRGGRPFAFDALNISATR